jgi:glucosamine--fructose-6-phosphate aminotransferase (isomerizing)
MCGIFGVISSGANVDKHKLGILVSHAQQRGRDSSGLIYRDGESYRVSRADYGIKRLLKKERPWSSQVVLGHSRLITNGFGDNQPVIRDDICVIHNGIIVNEEEVWRKLKVNRKYQIDSELIVAIAEQHLDEKGELGDLPRKILGLCKGVIACALTIPSLGKVLLFSNNGSLFVSKTPSDVYFASESYALSQIGCKKIDQIMHDACILDIPVSASRLDVYDDTINRHDLIPEFRFNKAEEDLLEYRKPQLRRCTRCVLPETMPFINFDSGGVCNYCRHYKLRNKTKPKDEIFALMEPYRRKNGSDCIVPFSGGRDSCYALHLIVHELKLKPITYTYDWGMVTDLGRRNISRMCAELGVENIIVAADIAQKRRNIAMNLRAWLKSPHLGMISVFTAGDKHFFRHVETVKRQTGINLNLWGINPLEVTHFKTGFLGIKPDFEEKRVYTHGMVKQFRYHGHRLRAMLASPGYFNSSLWDTLSGEYYRSFTEKKDYYHVFDYWRWDEEVVDQALAGYQWEKAVDTNTTWRIGDGTAAFYNYIYYTVAGFTEHDTFRSNQIREGQMTREKALELVEDENRPRYQNIRWYLDTLGMDYTEVIKVINAMPKLYNDR